MFWRKKSYSDYDVLSMAAEIRQIDEDAEAKAKPIPEGLLAWANSDPNNKRKVDKAQGIIHGVIAANFDGDPSDFQKYFKEVILQAFNYGSGANFGKMMHKTHVNLGKELNQDYIAGIEEGKKQFETGEDYYLNNRLSY